MTTWLRKRAIFAHRQLYLSGLLNPERLALPHFLGLGPGQSGTTWLARHLGDHPDVYIPPVKETHYFDQTFHDASLRDYGSLFETAGDRLRGEITPGYSILQPDRIRDVARLMPEVRLVLNLRNPIDRSWSAARRFATKLGTTLGEMADEQLFEYLKLEWAYVTFTSERLQGSYQDGLLEGHYCRAIDNWLGHFSEEQLLLVFFDDIRRRPLEVLQTICRHIGADPSFSWDEKAVHVPVNPNPPHPLPGRVHRFLEEMYRTEIEQIAARYGGPAKKWLEELT